MLYAGLHSVQYGLVLETGHGAELIPVFDFVVDRLTVSGEFGLGYYQPKFICKQVVETKRHLMYLKQQFPELLHI